MMNRFSPHLCAVTALTILTITLAAGNAHAYLDPGTGSYVLQIIIAALLGVSFATKMFWLRIRTFFGSLISRRPKGK